MSEMSFTNQASIIYNVTTTSTPNNISATNEANTTYNPSEISINITSAKTDIKLAVNKSLYLKGVISEEMYIKVNEILIKNLPSKIS